LEISLVFVVPAEPAKVRVLDAATGAVPESQFPVVLQFVSPPPPVQLYVPAAEAGVASATVNRTAASKAQKHRLEL